jgi:hypothetical protein
MEKFLLTCFLALLCLYGSATIAQVADSPPGREGSFLPLPKGELLVYGELINPDSLGVLMISYSEVFLSQGMALRDSSFQLDVTHGTFYDGVLDPRAKKFLTRIPVKDGPILLNLNIGQRSLLRDYLAFAGDSIKVGIDLQEFSLVFSGPQADWFEVQHAVKRAQAAARFGASRAVLENDREGLLAQADYRARTLAQDTVFGSRMVIYEFGRDGLDLERDILLDTSRHAIPGWTVLQSFRERIPQDRLSLLESQLVGAHHAGHLATFRKYHYGMPLALGDSLSAKRAKAAMPEILDKLDTDLSEALDKGLSPGALDLARDWSATARVLDGARLEASIAQKYRSPVRDRLLLSTIRKQLQLGGIPDSAWDYFAAQLDGSTVASGFDALKAAFRPGTALIPATFFDLEGEEVSLRDFSGRPTLLYFYFSGCTHSGNYFRRYLWPFYQETGKAMGLRLIAVSVDRDPALWRSELSNYSNMELINLNLPSNRWADWLDRYLISGFPRTMLLDEEGKVLSHSLGGKDYHDYRSRILFLLDSPQSITDSTDH